MNTTESRFTITVVNPESGCTVIEDATLADRPAWRRRVAVFRGPDALAQATAELTRIEAAMDIDPRTPIDRCVSKIGEPYAMHECGRALAYRTGWNEGWRHLDDSVNDGECGRGFPQREL